ncbi:hypothetical protein Ctob_011023, partial [Chrysochromulina tobinii]
MALALANSDTLGLGSADTAALFHQIVFESKIYSALHGCIFASLNHAFRTWRWMVGSEAEGWRREVDSLHSKLIALEKREAAAVDVIVNPRTTEGKEGVKKSTSRELAAFRNAREQLAREAASVTADVGSNSSSSGETPSIGRKGAVDGEPTAAAVGAAADAEVQRAHAMASAWESALRHVLRALDPDSEERRIAEPVPLPSNLFSGSCSLGAADLTGRCVESIRSWAGETRRLATTVQSERLAAAQAAEAAGVSHSRCAKLGTRVQTLEAQSQLAEAKATKAQAALRAKDEELLALEAELRAQIQTNERQGEEGEELSLQVESLQARLAVAEERAAEMEGAAELARRELPGL